MSCVDLMAATPEGLGKGRGGARGAAAAKLLITNAACRHCCQFGPVFDSCEVRMVMWRVMVIG